MEPMNWTVHVRKDGCEVWTGSQVLSPARATAGGLLRYARQGRFAPGRGVRAEAERHRLPQPHRRGRVAGKAFRRLLKAAGLPGFRLYDLRHTYASLLLAAGAPITYVSGPARPRESDDYAPLLREVDPEQGTALGRGAGRSRSTRRGQFWNQNLEPTGSLDEGRRASGGEIW